MRYVSILTLASITAMTGIAFSLEWFDAFAVLAVVTTVIIGLPVLSLASNFWFGETPPQVHVHEQYDGDDNRLSWLNQRDGRRSPKRAAN